MATAIKLDHPTDPRYLIVSELPERIAVEDLGVRRFGTPLIIEPAGVPVVTYEQPDGFGTDWLRPES